MMLGCDGTWWWIWLRSWWWRLEAGEGDERWDNSRRSGGEVGPGKCMLPRGLVGYWVSSGAFGLEGSAMRDVLCAPHTSHAIFVSTSKVHKNFWKKYIDFKTTIYLFNLPAQIHIILRLRIRKFWQFLFWKLVRNFYSWPRGPIWSCNCQHKLGNTFAKKKWKVWWLLLLDICLEVHRVQNTASKILEDVIKVQCWYYQNLLIFKFLVISEINSAIKC